MNVTPRSLVTDAASQPDLDVTGVSGSVTDHDTPNPPPPPPAPDAGGGGLRGGGRAEPQTAAGSHLVELTAAGEALFDRLRGARLRGAAVEHDTRLREGLSEDDLARLADLLDRIRRNVESG